jgi:hypothetical protein
MNLKTLSAVALGATFVALSASAVSAKPMPADQFHWSSAVENGTFKYNGKPYTLTSEKMGSASDFIASCKSEVRVRGFLNAYGREEWGKAEFLCGQPGIGGDAPVDYKTGGEIKVFGPIYMTSKNNVLSECRPYSNSGARIWTNCGALVPNDRTSMVFVGDGSNSGKAMETAKTGSGIETVRPILFPEVEQMREKIFQERLASGYYNNK